MNAVKQVRKERENCCDDMAVAAGGNRVQHVQALTRPEAQRSAGSVAVLAATGGSLLDRVKRLLGQLHAEFGYRSVTAWFSALVAIVVVSLALAMHLDGTRLLHSLAAQTPPYQGAINPHQTLGWGPVTDGLRMAVNPTRPNVPYTLGTKIEIDFHVRNVSPYPITIAGYAWSQDGGSDSFVVNNDQGEILHVRHVLRSGMRPIQRNTLKTGEVAVFKSTGLAFLAEGMRKSEHSAGHTVVTGAGRYTLQCTLNFPRVGMPLPTDWQGTLQSGVHEIVIVDAPGTADHEAADRLTREKVAAAEAAAAAKAVEARLKSSDAHALDRFLTIERFARLPRDEQANQLTRFYRDLNPRYINSVIEGILSSAPHSILDGYQQNDPYDGNTDQWARQLAEAAAEMTVEQVAMKIEHFVWLNVAARARALDILKQHAFSTRTLIAADLNSREPVAVDRACTLIVSLALKTFTEELVNMYLAQDELSKAAWGALVWIRDPVIVPTLLNRVVKAPEFLVVSSGLFLGPLSDKPAEPQLFELLDSPDPDIRYHAAYALQECRDPELASPTVRLARETEPRFRSMAAQWASKLPAPSFLAIREALLPLLSDPNETVRYDALRSFGQRKDLAAGPVILALLQRNELTTEQHKIVVMQAMGSLSGKTWRYDMHNWGLDKPDNARAIDQFKSWLETQQGHGSISGTVTDADGRPAVGYRVTALPRQWAHFSGFRPMVKTDRFGVFTFRGLPIGPCDVAVTSNPKTNQPNIRIQGVDLIEDTTTWVVLSLEQEYSFKGRFTDAGGRPQPDRLVLAVWKNPTGGASYSSNTKTDPEGRYSFISPFEEAERILICDGGDRDELEHRNVQEGRGDIDFQLKANKERTLNRRRGADRVFGPQLNTLQGSPGPDAASESASGHTGWGEPNKGVQASLTGLDRIAGRSDWAHPVLRLRYDVRNSGMYTLHLPENGLDHQVEVDGQWYAWIDPPGSQGSDEPTVSLRGGRLLDFQPGSQHQGQVIDLAGNWRAIPKGKEDEYAAQSYSGTWYTVPQGDTPRAELVLTPGRHRIRVAVICPSARAPFHGVVRVVTGVQWLELGLFAPDGSGGRTAVPEVKAPDPVNAYTLDEIPKDTFELAAPKPGDRVTVAYANWDPQWQTGPVEPKTIRDSVRHEHTCTWSARLSVTDTRIWQASLAWRDSGRVQRALAADSAAAFGYGDVGAPLPFISKDGARIIWAIYDESARCMKPVDRLPERAIVNRGDFKFEAGFIPEKTEIMTGEAIYTTFYVKNTGERTIFLETGGDGRSIRSYRFQFSATDEQGLATRDPHSNPGHFGGPQGPPPAIKPGETYAEKLQLGKWLTLDQPGQYRVHCARTLQFPRMQDFTQDYALVHSLATSFRLKVVPQTDQGLTARISDLSQQLRAETDENNARLCAQLLVDTGDARIIDDLLWAADKWSGDSWALRHLAGFRDDPRVTTLFRDALRTSRGNSRRSNAAQLMGGSGHRAFVPDLLRAFSQEDDRFVLTSAATALGAFADAQAIPVLKTRRDHAYAPLRLAVEQALVQCGEALDAARFQAIIRSADYTSESAAYFVSKHAGASAFRILAECLDFDHPEAELGQGYADSNPANRNWTLLMYIAQAGGPRVPYHLVHDRPATAEEIEENRRALAEIRKRLELLR